MRTHSRRTDGVPLGQNRRNPKSQRRRPKISGRKCPSCPRGGGQVAVPPATFFSAARCPVQLIQCSNLLLLLGGGSTVAGSSRLRHHAQKRPHAGGGAAGAAAKVCAAGCVPVVSPWCFAATIADPLSASSHASYTPSPARAYRSSSHPRAEGDRKAYYETSQWTIKQNRETLAAVKACARPAPALCRYAYRPRVPAG